MEVPGEKNYLLWMAGMTWIWIMRGAVSLERAQRKLGNTTEIPEDRWLHWALESWFPITGQEWVDSSKFFPKRRLKLQTLLHRQDFYHKEFWFFKCMRDLITSFIHRIKLTLLWLTSQLKSLVTDKEAAVITLWIKSC